jgi:hypothetical protein
VLRGETPVRSKKNIENYKRIPQLLDQMLPTIEKNLKNTENVWRRSWECLEFYTRLCYKMALALQLLAEGKKEEVQSVWTQIRFLACENEPRFQREFDVFNFLLVWEIKILRRLQKQEEILIE